MSELYQNFINERVIYLSSNLVKDTYVSAFNIAQIITGPSLATNKKYISLDDIYMYQVMDIGSPLNKALRKGKITQFLYSFYKRLCRTFDNCVGLDQSVTVFRGIPTKDLGDLQIGDVISDPAFNSVSLDPNTAKYFGDSLLIIKLKYGNKIIYAGGHDDLYYDIFEFILPSGTTYKIFDKMYLNILGSRTCCYVVEIIGTINGDLIVDTTFDKKYVELMSPMIQCLEDNEKKERVDQTAVIEEGNFYWFVHEIGCFRNFDSLYKDILKRSAKDDKLIIQSTYLYVRSTAEVLNLSLSTFDEVKKNY